MKEINWKQASYDFLYVSRIWTGTLQRKICLKRSSDWKVKRLFLRRRNKVFFGLKEFVEIEKCI